MQGHKYFGFSFKHGYFCMRLKKGRSFLLYTQFPDYNTITKLAIRKENKIMTNPLIPKEKEKTKLCVIFRSHNDECAFFKDEL